MNKVVCMCPTHHPLLPSFLFEPTTDDVRAYGFARIETGDELSKRQKFALITWIGQTVSPLKKARVSTDKGLLKQVVSVCTFLRFHYQVQKLHSPILAKINV